MQWVYVVETLELDFVYWVDVFDCLHNYASLLCLLFYFNQCLSIKDSSCKSLDLLTDLAAYVNRNFVWNIIVYSINYVVKLWMSCKLLLRSCPLHLTVHFFLLWCLNLHCRNPTEAGVCLVIGTVTMANPSHHAMISSPTVHQSKDHSDWNQVLSSHPEMLNMFWDMFSSCYIGLSVFCPVN